MISSWSSLDLVAKITPKGEMHIFSPSAVTNSYKLRSQLCRLLTVLLMAVAVEQAWGLCCSFLCLSRFYVMLACLMISIYQCMKPNSLFNRKLKCWTAERKEQFSLILFLSVIK
ncbi:hypothetical protein O6P43_030514 [Quillaja saponaria]|uniref:Uncharacterized protein n=1 Tax=Quillaja saponaria TaxID=32244 RepID=A0AAD7KTD6_QUISA|nr:hypothetical protein O6P43_030514 [Quillaja saponaria]